jgi:hypothetical protein
LEKREDIKMGGLTLEVNTLPRYRNKSLLNPCFRISQNSGIRDKREDYQNILFLSPYPAWASPQTSRGIETILLNKD